MSSANLCGCPIVSKPTSSRGLDLGFLTAELADNEYLGFSLEQAESFRLDLELQEMVDLPPWLHASQDFLTHSRDFRHGD